MLLPDTLSGEASAAPAVRAGSPVLSIIVPTFNERDNVRELVHRLDAALTGVPWEVVFVDDDSTDGTADAVRVLCNADPRVRCLQRIGRRGLSSACVEGILSTASPYVAVMDADLQHDERLLPRMLGRLRESDLDIVVASRYVDGGSVGNWERRRAVLSRFATRLSRLIVRAHLHDPMSGFFMLRREAFMGSAHRLSNVGFKVLLDIFSSAPRPLKFEEVPYRFGSRQAGRSKLDALVMWEFMMLVADKLVGRVVPARFIAFCIVGALGVVVHMSVLATALKLSHLGFEASQATATIVAIAFNFMLNNVLTYRDKRLHGAGLLRGLASFYAACGLGAIANVGVAGYIFQRDHAWWLSGFAGILVGSVWNYAATSVLTWRK